MNSQPLENRTPFAAQVLFGADEDGRPLAIVLVKGTFDVVDDGCILSLHQKAPRLAPEWSGPQAEKSSLRYESEVAFTKPATDVVLLGHAYAPTKGTRTMDISLRVGPVGKAARVLGNRRWRRHQGQMRISAPEEFERIPLLYENAFGGTLSPPSAPGHVSKESPDDLAEEPMCDLRNPVGKGLCRTGYEEDTWLPNLEALDAPIVTPEDRPDPVGFGYVCAHWQPRLAFAGTYDEAWAESRAPRYPKDFDRRFFNASSPGLRAPGYLRGDERVVALGMKKTGAFSCALPGVAPPQVRFSLTKHPDLHMATNLDTVLIEPDDGRVELIWRCHALLRAGPHELRSVIVANSS